MSKTSIWISTSYTSPHPSHHLFSAKKETQVIGRDTCTPPHPLQIYWLVSYIWAHNCTPPPNMTPCTHQWNPVKFTNRHGGVIRNLRRLHLGMNIIIIIWSDSVITFQHNIIYLPFQSLWSLQKKNVFINLKLKNDTASHHIIHLFDYYIFVITINSTLTVIPNIFISALP